MKKLLFSRSQKKHFSDTVVRIGKNNLGFSLVELIVIIAIMAVLVAIAIPVLGMFIEKAKINNDKQAVSDVLYAIRLGGQSSDYMQAVDVPQLSGDGLKLPVGMIVITDSGLTAIGSNTSNQNVLDGMLEDALGSEYQTSYKVKYEEWGVANHASFFENADEMLEYVSQTGQTTLTYLNKFKDKMICDYENGCITALGKSLPILSRDYKDSDELTYCMAQKMAADDFSKDNFIQLWISLDNGNGKSAGFGFGEREYYSAARIVYNRSFSNYIKNHVDDTHTNASGHISQIINYGQNGNEMLEEKASWLGSILGRVTGADQTTFPFAVGQDAFSNLSSNATNFQNCQQCHDAWGVYSQSEQARTDAEAFYQMMMSIAEYDGSNDAGNPGAGVIDWISENTDGFTHLYGELEAVTTGKESCLVITVYQDPETGLLYGECNTPGVLDE